MSSENYTFCPQCGSRLESRLQFGKPRETCPQCGFIHFVEAKVAVGVMVEQDGQVLLVRRTQQPHRGEWSLPAGFMDAFEEPEKAAARECLEETGLEVQIQGLLTVVGGREHPHGADVVILYKGIVSGGHLAPGDDADRAAFFAPGELPSLAFRSTQAALEEWEKGMKK